MSGFVTASSENNSVYVLFPTIGSFCVAHVALKNHICHSVNRPLCIIISTFLKDRWSLMVNLLRLNILSSVLVLSVFIFPGFSSLPTWAQSNKVVQDESIKDLEGTVEVSFKIDMNGKLDIVSINATDPKLGEYVINKLKKIKLEKGDPQIGQVIKYRFVFKKQV
ncbi:MAG: hypothetical protein ACK4WD_09955 [Flavobacteriales bacterium]|jgi:hypothetical protein